MRNRISQRKHYWSLVITLYSLVLFGANFVGDHSLRIFYFTFSMGTLFVQLVFCAVVAFTESLGIRKSIKLVWITGGVNFLIALVVYYLLNFPFPEFWSKQNTENEVFFSQFIVTVMFSVSYMITAFCMIKIAVWLRLLLGRGWLLFRLMIVIFSGFIVDMTILSPVLYYLGPDRYMAIWKMLSLISVRLTMTLFAIPFSLYLVRCLRNKSFNPKWI